MKMVSILRLLLISVIGTCHSMVVPRRRQQQRFVADGTVSRRGFSAALVGAASSMLLQEKAEAFWNPFEKEKPYTYADFKRMLHSGEILQVTFGVGGTSLVCIDATGVSRALADLPDDKALLNELYREKVAVSMEDIPPQQMSAADWFKDVMGFEELTDEEKYKYRGYKTFRQNVQGEVPASLLTNFGGK